MAALETTNEIVRVRSKMMTYYGGTVRYFRNLMQRVGRVTDMTLHVRIRIPTHKVIITEYQKH